ncbi:TonB-dependent receptor plug domain-containing protein, partial [Pseudomonadales bacterium]|nr:TonB-dependent receptor plug domain-containing protein [Pseudomonadales bacterium]
MVYKNKINAFYALIVLLPLVPSVNVHAQEAESTIEEVVVYSIRQSLESALAEKRQKTNLTEVINADDIGKLPDENVAEVLENIPGVQITRNAGIGQGVSIRGSDQNRVEINGRGTTPSGDQRGGISFSDLPAALVRSLNVVKVPTADMVEGSLGGTINVKTYRGLKLKKPLRVVRYQSEYAQNAEEWNANYSTTLGDKFFTDFGDIGAILTISHIDKTVREDGLRVSPGIRRVTGNPQTSIDFDGDGDFDPY